MLETTHLTLEENCPHAVEELVGRDYMALHQDASTQCGCHPPSCADGHLVEPLFEWEASHHAIPTSEHIRHGCKAGYARSRERVQVRAKVNCSGVRRPAGK